MKLVRQYPTGLYHNKLSVFACSILAVTKKQYLIVCHSRRESKLVLYVDKYQVTLDNLF